MANERITDFFIGKLLSDANISYVPNGSKIKEIQDALKTASKKGNNRIGFPEFTAKVNDFIIVIEIRRMRISRPFMKATIFKF